MRSRNVLLRFIAKAVVNSASGGLPVGDFLVDVLPVIAQDAYAAWTRWRSAEEQRSDIEDLVLITDSDASRLATEFAADVAADQPLAIRQIVTDYLALVPAAVRTSLDEQNLTLLPSLSLPSHGRHKDPAGMAVKPDAVPQSADDLMRLLPSPETSSFLIPPAVSKPLIQLVVRPASVLELASVDYDGAISSDPKDAFAYVNRGLDRKAKGDHDGAIDDYNQALAIDPQYALAYRCRGDARRAKSEWNAAVSDYSRAISFDPLDALAFRFRGMARAAKGDLDEAIEDYDQAIRIDPKDTLAYIKRGLVREAEGSFALAIADYDHAIDIHPRDYHTYIKRGQTRQVQGDSEGSSADFAEASRLASMRPGH